MKSHSSLNWLPGEKFLEWTTRGESLDTDTVSHDLSFLLELEELGHNVISEPVLSGDEHHLATGELELGSSKSFLSGSNVFRVSSDGDKDGSNVDASTFAESLSIGVAHTGLESISTGAGEHLVDTD